MRARLLAMLLAAAMGTGFGRDAQAQGRTSNFGSGSSMGQLGGYSSQSSALTFGGSRNYGQTVTGRSRTGTSMGSSGFGGLSGFGGMGGFGSMGGLGSMGRTSSNIGMGQFGQNPWAAMSSQAGRFVGANLTGLRTGSSAYGFGAAGGYNTAYSNYGTSAYGSSPYGSTARSGARGTSRYGTTNSANQGLVSTTMVIGFDPPAANVAHVSSQLTARLEKTGRFRSAPEVLLENGVATLRGVVATDHDRVIAEQLVRLEPGVAEVRNELTLAWPSATPRPSSSVTPPSSARPPAAN